jgi:uncharacterized protein (TIGR02680 family)
MTQNRWVLNRAGIFNFWYYDDEEFHFADGKLLLRGANASGKSVTMQSLIPLLLDGRKSPDRLDPFGSRSRRMEDYLLGEKELVDRDERTGYLYLEYKKSSANQYVTTGIGLQARRHGSLNFWGFVINDNRRIGRDFYLYKTERGAGGEKDKIPLTRPELETRIGPGGRVVRTQGNYMELVNRHVFGFPTAEAFEELIKLIIQLRSPKLSKDFKPTVIYEILNDSLPPLTDEELRPLSDTIENMDQAQQQLEQLKREQAAVQRLCRQYNDYNRYMLAEKAQGFIAARQKLTRQEQAEAASSARIIELGERLSELDEQIAKLRTESVALTEERRTLVKHEVFNIEEEKHVVEQALADLAKQERQKKETLRKKEEAETDLRYRADKEEENRVGHLKETEIILKRLASGAEAAQFAAHEAASRDYAKHINEAYHFGLWKEEAGVYAELLERVVEALKQVARYRERYQEADRELGETRKELDQQRRKEKEWYRLFEEERDKLISEIHRWLEGNRVLLPDNGGLTLLLSRCNVLFEEVTLDELREPMEESYRKLLNALEAEKLQLEHRLEQKDKEIKEKKAELKHWREKEDPEPPRHPDTAAARRKLEQKGIPHLPFFAAVEFRPEVSSSVRERIEGALREMGLLDALILSAQAAAAAPSDDRIIKAGPPQPDPTLADYLYPTPVEGVAVAPRDIETVLRSIKVSGKAQAEAPALDEKGRYHLSLLHGHAPVSEQAVYIGSEARRRYREREIKRISEELTVLESDYFVLEVKACALQDRRYQLDIEYQSFPPAKDVCEAYNLFKEAGPQVAVLAREVENKDRKVQELLAKLQEVAARVRAAAAGLPFEAAEESCQQALSEMRDYLSDLHALELAHKDLLRAVSMFMEIKGNLLSIEGDIRELRLELKDIDAREKVKSSQLNLLEHTLLQMGVAEVRERINRVEKRLRLIPPEIEGLVGERGSLKQEQSQVEKEKEKIGQGLRGYRNLVEAWQSIFLAELKLELALKQEELEHPAAPEHAFKLARRVSHQLARVREESTREKVYTGLTRIFYQEQGVLAEYRPSLDEVQANNQFQQNELPTGQEFILQCEAVERSSVRVLLLLEYDGKRINPYTVLKRMQQDMVLQEQLLSEKDRELYEEIIAYNVGRVIRGRINRAEQWVKQIDTLMAQRNTSGALTFSLSWRPGTAQHEDEMDTRELVDLLRRDPRILKEQDFEKIVQHFRSKIERAREAMEEKGFGETFHQLIKEILDYRRWFSFTLYYRRGDQQKRELTNHAFYTFSGGEKAMAMYIPLFSAAYSRYLEAGPEAPFIISLDEAFAGVDEQNIADMFDVMEQLGFNYLINSQSLWGDYDTVPGLSICELIRPQNAPFVSVARYVWNGSYRRLITTKEELE